MAKKTAAKKKGPAKKPARKKPAPSSFKKTPAPLSAAVISMAVVEILGPELALRLEGSASQRNVDLFDVLRQAVQDYLEAEFVDPTTDAKDEALYPPTDHPLEEAPVLRSKEPDEESVHERTTLPGEVPPDNGTAH